VIFNDSIVTTLTAFGQLSETIYIIYSPLPRILLFYFYKIKTLASAINYYNLVALIAEARVSRYHSASLYFSRNISFIGPIRPPSFYRRRCRRPLLSFLFASDAPRWSSM